MRLVLDRCSVVIVGAWNLAIFSPEWVGPKVFPDEPDLEFGVSIAPGVGTETRYRVPTIEMSASAGRLQFKPRTDGEEAFRATEERAKAVLRLLPETPVRALGINFGFDATAIPALAELLSSPDLPKLAAAGTSILTTKILRTARFDGGELTFSVEHDAGADFLQLDFNHHLAVKSGQEALKSLDGGVLRARSRSLSFLYQVYGMKE